MKKLLLIGIFFVGGCSQETKPFNQEEIIDNNKTYEPRKVAEIEGKDLYMVPVKPWGPNGMVHFLYYFKEGEVKSINFQTTSQSGKYTQIHDHTVIIDGSPYKKQEVPNE